VFLNILLFLIFVGCFASLFTGGLWTNALMLINTVTAALLATNYFEPLADWLERSVDPSWTYQWDFIALWLIFGLSMSVLRAATDAVSKVKVRFHPLVDQIGNYAFAAWTGWVLLCFATMTLHTAPLSRNFLGGAFQEQPESRMFFGLAPDRLWMSWVHKESKGSLCRLREIVPFDAGGDFILRYANRREDYDHILTVLKPKGAAAAAPATPQ
jgi:hypothetical protein